MSEAGTNGGEQRRIAPGSGRRRSPAYHKGRQLDTRMRDEIAVLLGGLLVPANA